VFSVVLSVVGLRITSNNSKNKIGLFVIYAFLNESLL